MAEMKEAGMDESEKEAAPEAKAEPVWNHETGRWENAEDPSAPPPVQDPDPVSDPSQTEK